MSEENRGYSRVSKYNKRRNNKRTLIVFSSLALLFMIILFSLIALNKGKQDVKTNKPQDTIETSQQSDETNSENEAGDSLGDSADEIEDEENGVSLENSEPTSEGDSLNEIDVIESDDENVIRAYKGNWEPIGTSQVGEHVTNYNDGSDDRVEIKRATSQVTGISEDDMIEWRVGNDGDQKVFSVISNKAKSDYYKLYLSWIDKEGWQVTKVEKIKTFNQGDYD